MKENFFLKVLPLGQQCKAAPLPMEGRYEHYRDLCHQHVPGWSALSLDQLVLTPMLGGLSNELFVCEAASSNGVKKVVVRIYGPAMSLLVDAKQERAISKALSQAKLGPSIYYEFEDGSGRIEQFLEGKVLHYLQLHSPDVSANLARYLAKFHAQQITIADMPTSSQMIPRMQKWLALAVQAMQRPSEWLGPVRTNHREQLLREMNFERFVGKEEKERESLSLI